MKKLMIILIALSLGRCISKEEGINIKRTYYKSGKLKAEAEFNSDSLKHGFANLYYENGQKELQTEYEDGKKNGPEIGYFKNGNVKYKMTYSNGVPIGEMYDYYEGGGLKFYSFYDPVGQGVYRAHYDTNGIFLKEEGTREPLNVIKTLKDFEFQIGDTLDLTVYVPNPPNFNQRLEIQILNKNNNQKELKKITIKNGKVMYKKKLSEEGSYVLISTLILENNSSKSLERYSTDLTFKVR